MFAYGGYGVMVTLELVELSTRVRFPIVTHLEIFLKYEAGQ